MLDRREELLPTRSGLPTARCNGIYLHSQYDPLKEADQYLRSLSLPAKPGTILVLGSGMGYLEYCLEKRYPQRKILSIQFSPFFEGKTHHSLPPSQCWHPGQERTVEEFLYHQIEGAEFVDLQIVSWRPGFQAYPDVSRWVSEKVLQVIREMSRSIQTTYMFGRKWILNSIRNFLFHSPLYRLNLSHHPVCIVASGPSLNRSLPDLHRYRDRYLLWALPSSLLALYQNRLAPDLVIMTDGGSHAPRLVHPWLRQQTRAGSPLNLAIPITAAFIPPHPCLRTVLFHQGTGIERLFLRSIPFPLEYVPSNGTVAGTALELAMKITTGPILLFGLDLCTEGSLEHVRPHPFEVSFESSRVRGTETPWIDRILELYPLRISRIHRTSPSLSTYAGWFRTHSFRWKNRVVRISPSPMDTGMEERPSSFLEAFPPIASSSLLTLEPEVSWEERKRTVRKALEDLQESLPAVDPDIARAFDLLKSTPSRALDPRKRLGLALERILKDLGGRI
ncbi:MAG: hypothetical protein Kow009_06950 [Spirochaetales bacterium]